MPLGGHLNEDLIAKSQRPSILRVRAPQRRGPNFFSEDLRQIAAVHPERLDVSVVKNLKKPGKKHDPRGIYVLKAHAVRVSMQGRRDSGWYGWGLHSRVELGLSDSFSERRL